MSVSMSPPSSHAVSTAVTSIFSKDVKEFKAGASYNVYITIYGFEKIEVTAVLTAWEGFSKEQEATFRLEEFLKRRYEFRFNTVQKLTIRR